MVVLDHAEIERPPKRRRYFIINDETYVEFPEAVNGNNAVQHLVPISETNFAESATTFSTNGCESESKDSVNHEMQFEFPSSKICIGNAKSLLHSNQIISVNETDCNNIASLPKNGTDNKKKDIVEEAILVSDEEDFENNQNCIKFVETDLSVNEEYLENNTDDGCIRPPIKEVTTKDKVQLRYVKDGEVKVKISDHFPIDKFSIKISLSESNSHDSLKGNLPGSSGKSITKCPYCSFKIPLKNIVRHIGYAHVKPCFCSECNTVLPLNKLKQHLRDTHIDNLRCLKCPYQGNVEKKFKKHVLCFHRGALMRQCSICGYWLKKTNSFKSQIKILVKHVKYKHLEENPHCASWNFLMEPSYPDFNYEMFHCSNCLTVTNSLTSLLYHVSKHHSQELIRCDFCKFTHSSEIWMKLHRRTHFKPAYKCPYCKYKNSKHYLLKYHMRDKHKRQYKMKF